MNRDVTLLQEIIHYCDDILEILDRVNHDEEIFMDDRMYQAAVAFNLLQIGELAKRLSDDIKSKYLDEETWSNIAGTRDIMAHKYHRVNMTVQWRTINKDIVPLKETCQEMLDGTPDS